MRLEPEDLISPEGEAEMQRSAVMSQSEDVAEALLRFRIAIDANPESVEPGVREMLAEAASRQLHWMRQNGIDLPQQDVDEELESGT